MPAGHDDGGARLCCAPLVSVGDDDHWLIGIVAGLCC
jgi:hypothetical protein